MRHYSYKIINYVVESRFLKFIKNQLLIQNIVVLSADLKTLQRLEISISRYRPTLYIK